MKVLVIGGAGYVGTVLVDKLLQLGHNVTCYDLMIYGSHFSDHSNLNLVKGDIRDLEFLEKNVIAQDCIIHLACISNDPSFELNPTLGKSINYDCFEPLVKLAVKHSVKKFVYASSSSVYGVKSDINVTENTSLEPLTDYSKFKVLCENVLLKYRSDKFETVIIRPATVCGYSPRQRLDVIVNIFVNHAFNNKKIKIFGGSQLRPNIHIDDMVQVYLDLLSIDTQSIIYPVYNVGFENHKVQDIAEIVKKSFNKKNEEIQIIFEDTDDLRSYHIDSNKIKEELNFKPKKTIKDAVDDLIDAFENQKLLNTMNDKIYYNIQQMNFLNIK
jgi:nucleoside-diphosphate-sugar epimerase